MSQQAVQTITELLANLSQEELGEVITRARYFSKHNVNAVASSNGTTTATPDEEDNYTLFYNVLSNAVEEEAGIPLDPYFKVRNSPKQFKRYKAAIDAIDALFERTAPQTTKLYRARFYHLCARLVLEDYREYGVPLMMRALVTGLENAPALLEAEYPGYVQCGMMGFIIKQQNLNAKVVSAAATARKQL